MIAFSEIGPKLLAVSDNGYNVIVGSTPEKPILFHDYSDHPRRSIWIATIGKPSTAAGRYQVLARYFDAFKSSLKLPDFSPASQDRIVLDGYLRECRAQDDVLAGRIEDAIHKCASRWASFPGANYEKQKMNKMISLLEAYQKAGGVLA